MSYLAGKRALVTGAGGGLGREIAKALAGNGAHLLLHGRHADHLNSLSREIADAGGSCEVVVADLQSEDAAAALMTRGPVQILVNNAGARDRRPLADLDRAAVRRLLEVNLVAPLDLARRVAAGMSPGGRIINITSIAGQIARSGDAAYTMSKGGAGCTHQSIGGGTRAEADHGECDCARLLCYRGKCGDGCRSCR